MLKVCIYYKTFDEHLNSVLSKYIKKMCIEIVLFMLFIIYVLSYLKE